MATSPCDCRPGVQFPPSLLSNTTSPQAIMETTPLLSESRNSSSSPDHHLPSSRRTGLVTTISIAPSIVSFIFTLTTGIWIKCSPDAPNFDWATEECGNLVLILSLLSAFSLALNIVRHRKELSGFSAFFAFVVDACIAFYCVGLAARGFEELGFSSTCPSRYSECRPVVVDVLLRVGFAFAIVLGVIHTLFFLRALVAGVRNLRQGYNTWRLPTGQFTVEFTIKILRQEDLEGTRRNSEPLP